VRFTIIGTLVVCLPSRFSNGAAEGLETSLPTYLIENCIDWTWQLGPFGFQTLWLRDSISLSPGHLRNPAWP
jgi:hypothetical protein